MASDSSPVETQTVEEARRHIQELVRRIRELSDGDHEPSEYFAEFLQLVVQGLNAPGGAVWGRDDGGTLAPLYHLNLSHSLLDTEEADGQLHFRLVERVFAGRESESAPPHSSTGENGRAGNPTDYLLLFAPIVLKQETFAVVEVFQRPRAENAAQRGYLSFLTQMCNVAADWAKSRQLRRLDGQVSLLSRYDRFIKLVYVGLDLKQTAYAIANESRELVEADRISVAIQRGRKCRIEAVSGQDTLDRRSNVVGLLGTLATRVVATAEPLWYAGTTDDLPPQIEEALLAYVEESHAKTIVVVPIYQTAATEDDRETRDADDPATRSESATEVIGALIVEKIEGLLPRPQAQPQLELVADHAGRALSNSLAHSNLPFMPVLRVAGVVTGLFHGRTRRKTLAVLGVLLALLLCVALVPIDFEMEGRGTLQPVVRHDLFTAVEGKVVGVHVTSGQVVTKDQLLLELENQDVEIAIEQLRGEIEETNKAIETLNSSAFQARDMTRDERLRLFADLDNLETKRINLEKQRALHEQKKDSLLIRSPIDGRVATWDVEKLLRGRPVSPEQVLLTVFDPSGGWELELNMPEKKMGHVNDANRGLPPGQSLPVEYVLASEPGVTRYGTLEKIQPQTKLDEEQGHSVLLRVDIDVNDPQHPVQDPRLGILAKGQVQCGRRSIGYVYLHDAWEWVQVNVFFKFF